MINYLKTNLKEIKLNFNEINFDYRVVQNECLSLDYKIGILDVFNRITNDNKILIQT